MFGVAATSESPLSAKPLLELLERLWTELSSAVSHHVDPWILAAGLLVLAAILALGWIRATRSGSRRQRRRIRRASRGEADAERLLEAHGFSILDRQVTVRWTLRVDQEAREVSCRADLLLARDGQHWVADVKTGELAPDPRHPSTRRQLLEYLLAFEVDGVLLVDPEAGEVLEVDFSELLA